MTVIEIIPLVGINSIKLGMTEPQVKEVLKNLPFDNYEELFSRLEYDVDNKLHYIEVSNPFDEFDLQLIYNGIDLFKTKADDIIESISKHAPYIQDDESKMGYNFIFQELGLAFWRPDVMTEEMLNSKEFLTELSLENQEYEKRNFYFTTVSLFSPSYYD
ncbi:hypothetical protein [Paenibacillus campi]|uniref:hypothetical protein n=1 Tax=Paenibacillus campi TaxID=3106031 RepID=UPI002AFF5918|nr:hypothetical protein [Paenibacillus sp. SGZ-1014]